MKWLMVRAQWYSRSWEKFSGVARRAWDIRIPSTTAPITVWIFPSFAASVDANLDARAGAKLLEMGLKARWATDGRREARIDRWKPLQFIELASVSSPIATRRPPTYFLSMMGGEDVGVWLGEGGV